jgi:general secretion pathway protein K
MIRQRGVAGVALLTAMMVVAVVVTIAVRESWRANLDLHRHSHRWMSFQAKAYVEGAEQLAIAALEKDASVNTETYADEMWAERFEFPTDHGFLALQLQDLQGRLNVNALAEPFKRDNKNQILQSPQRYTATQKRFIRLLQTFEIEEDVFLDTAEAEAILEAVKDWVDADSVPSGYNGVEQNYYQSLDPPVTIPNKEMNSVSELLLIKGMYPSLYQSLLPHVSALPANEKLNINTIGVGLARSFNEPNDLLPIELADAQILVEEIVSSKLTSAQDFEDLPIIIQLAGTNSQGQANIDSSDLVFASNHFQLQSTAIIGDQVHKGLSWIQRSANGAKVIRRSDANF